MSWLRRNRLIIQPCFVALKQYRLAQEQRCIRAYLCGDRPESQVRELHHCKATGTTVDSHMNFYRRKLRAIASAALRLQVPPVRIARCGTVPRG